MNAPVYHNPVYPQPAPDPFVLKYIGQYWCYTTGIQPDGRAFGILHSTDLVHWRYIGSAMDLLPGEHTCYWAPEVTFDNGIFYLYYSVGDEEHMHIRTATAREPQGPFVDAGRRLTQEKFAIDAHVFLDDDGQRYLFYATDFLEVERVGTGTVMDRMLDPLTLVGAPRPVTRAGYDWQIYDPRRESKGGVCWHTVEGPFVLKHAGRYYQMFSGGNWQKDSYGVGYGVTDRLDQEGEWHQVCDAVETPLLLRSHSERGVIGPGHNSVVRGPDNREVFCVYHRWLPEIDERVLAIDRLEWHGEQLVVHGPSTTPQPAPLHPLVNGFKTAVVHGGKWETSDPIWRMIPTGGEVRAEVELPEGWDQTDWVLEVSFRSDGVEEFGVALGEMRLVFAGQSAWLETSQGRQTLLLRPDFDPLAFHLLRVEVLGGEMLVTIDGPPQRWNLPSVVPESIMFFARGGPVDWAGLAWTGSLPGPTSPASGL